MPAVGRLKTGTATVGSSMEGPRFKKKKSSRSSTTRYVSKEDNASLDPTFIVTCPPMVKHRHGPSVHQLKEEWQTHDGTLSFHMASIAVINHMTQSSMARKEFTSAYSSASLRELRASTQLRPKPGARADAEVAEECCFWVCASRLAQPVFLESPCPPD